MYNVLMGKNFLWGASAIAAAAIVIGVAGVAGYKHRGLVAGTSTNYCPSVTATGCLHTAGQQQAGTFDPSHGTCQGKGPVMFGASPFELKKLAMIDPMGQMVGSHVTPIDHGYMFGVGTPNVPFNKFGIYSPAKGYVVELSRTRRAEGKNNFIDYALTIEFSCTHYVHYSNMSSFAPRLLAAAGGTVALNQSAAIRVPVAEGEEVGRTGPFGIDLYVWDKDVNLTGYIVPEHYATESWKLHSADFFHYLKEPLKTQLLAKDLRQATPRFGKIDNDIDGRLIGNWFKVGTNGYAGPAAAQKGEGYWQGHLAIVPDALDPRGVVISIGSWPGEQNQFGVRSNKPDPKNVSMATGLVKYELVRFNWTTTSGGLWDHRSYIKGVRFKPSDSPAEGVLLVQLIKPRLLKVELFPGKTADQVAGFTSKALTYER